MGVWFCGKLKYVQPYILVIVSGPFKIVLAQIFSRMGASL
jgi:hypothetical protein